MGVLKSEARPHLKAPDQKRRWPQLFDRLNEAKGYNHLVSIGCENVKFIPRVKTDRNGSARLKRVVRRGHGFVRSENHECVG